MTQFYTHSFTVYHNNTKIQTVYCGDVLLDYVPVDFTHTLTWENLNDFYKKYGFHFPFSIYFLKKGRLVSFFNFKLRDKDTHDVKEWKTPLNIRVEHHYKLKTGVCLEDVLKWRNVDAAAQYLKERGLELKN